MELKASPVPPQFILPAATLSIFNSRINNSIASIPILPSISSSDDRIEDVGHRVYLAINELLQAVDTQLFPLIVALNFDYQTWIHQCREARIAWRKAGIDDRSYRAMNLALQGLDRTRPRPVGRNKRPREGLDFFRQGKHRAGERQLEADQINRHQRRLLSRAHER